ncbi:dienelactone hydrolase [Arthroderma uncinatum]|uniref:dienelactone hydrolase n=1 Tax=Arthroderma uncinatum TaxID=74035 RepID=UPI00144AF8DC|nr:dienelactone hydrolase [Arthroderma uncinatum]KAF3480325.1 dienelactone hydrolase [Arthroderma uncinatum]
MKALAAKALHPRRHSLHENPSSHYKPVRNRSELHFSWDETNPNIVISADKADFDPLILEGFKEEGFDIAYLPHTDNPKKFDSQLQSLQDSMEFGNKYAIVVVAYYPTYLPNFDTRSISSLRVKIHLAGSQVLVGKEHCYVYANSQVGFAQHDSTQYNPVTARLAWTRTVACLRDGFELKPDLEPIWERHLLMKYASKDLERTLHTFAEGSRINYVPTRTGGIGYDEIRRFYEEEFIPRNPPSLQIQLISRTQGSSHVVDEMYLSFQHTQEVPWILPRIPPTNETVEIAIVSVVSFRGGKLCHENIYWDQASVLVQVGLLDPTYIPPSFNPITNGINGLHGVRELPVSDGGSARSILQE